MTAITYIGHATTLIEVGRSRILTDPNFSSKVLLVKRSQPIQFDPGTLGNISAIVISHAHFDHLDLNSFKYIKSSVPVFTPSGLADLIGKFVRNPIIELSHWVRHKLPDGTEISAVPAKHAGFRWSGLSYRSSNGYLIADSLSAVYFAGDTGYGPHFKEIAKFAGMAKPIDIALLPIGGYSPAWFMRSRHLDPVEALQAFLETGAKHMIPIHFGMFKLSLERLSEPAEWLSRLAVERELIEQVHILNSGEIFRIDHSKIPTPKTTI